jgi:hypothetical protein
MPLDPADSRDSELDASPATGSQPVQHGEDGLLGARALGYFGAVLDRRVGLAPALQVGEQLVPTHPLTLARPVPLCPFLDTLWRTG